MGDLLTNKYLLVINYANKGLLDDILSDINWYNLRCQFGITFSEILRK